MEKTRSKVIEPIRFTAFTAYVLAPYVAHLLIKEDLGCTASEAFDIMLDSADVGQRIHPMPEGEDVEIETLIMENTRLGSKERAKVRDFILFIVFLIISESRHKRSPRVDQYLPLRQFVVTPRDAHCQEW